MVGASIQAAFGADTAPLAKGATEAQGIISRFAAGAQAALGAVGLALGAGQLVSFFRTIIDKAGELQDLSDRLDVSTDALQAFDYAARQAGATSEQVTATWDKAKRAVDSLLAGNKATAEQFAALGLSAKDFVGLNLEKALERIARAYGENANQAGAFEAVTEILGSRSAPKLNTAILQLSREGFGELIEKTRKAGVMLDKEGIQKFDELGDRLATLKQQAESYGSTILKWGLYYAEAQVAIRNFTQAALGMRELTPRDTVKAAKEQAEAVAEMNKALASATNELKQQRALEDERAKLGEILLRAKKDEAEGAARIRILEEERVKHLQAYLSLSDDVVAAQREFNKAAEIGLEIEKLHRKEREQAAKDRRLSTDEERELVVLMEKRAQGLNGQEQARLEVLQLQKTELEIQARLKAVLSGGAESLTEEDRKTVVALDRQLAIVRDQLQVRNSLLTSTASLVGLEAKRTQELATQEEIENRIAMLNDQAFSSSLGSLIGKVRGAEELGNASDAVLEEIARRGRAESDRLRNPLNPGFTPLNAATMASGNFFAKMDAARWELDAAAAERELAQRRTIRSYADFGTALRNYPGDPVNFDRIYENATRGLDVQQKSHAALERIENRFRRLLGE